MLVKPLVRSIAYRITEQLTSVVRSLGIIPSAGDYLLDAPAGNYLTDEIGNRLTA